MDVNSGRHLTSSAPVVITQFHSKESRLSFHQFPSVTQPRPETGTCCSSSRITLGLDCVGTWEESQSEGLWSLSLWANDWGGVILLTTALLLPINQEVLRRDSCLNQPILRLWVGLLFCDSILSEVNLRGSTTWRLLMPSFLSVRAGDECPEQTQRGPLCY